ncbi:hypothetical protein PN836_005970 [Ningiella sp. W23]|uniref:hypothetical protein n=1 Tax=Ningiella sp. W23 TaxID=3023715 RepID=UPI003758180B
MNILHKLSTAYASGDITKQEFRAQRGALIKEIVEGKREDEIQPEITGEIPFDDTTRKISIAKVKPKRAHPIKTLMYLLVYLTLFSIVFFVAFMFVPQVAEFTHSVSPELFRALKALASTISNFV